MEKIVTYRANDGEEFDTKTECEEYENSLNITSNKDIVMLDCRLRKIAGETVSALNSVAYLFLNSKDSISSYNRCVKYFGYTKVCDDYHGTWLEYNEALDVWESVDHKIEKLTEIRNSLSTALDNDEEEDINGSN